MSIVSPGSHVAARLRALAVDVDAAGLDRVGAERARLDEPRCPEPAIEADGVHRRMVALGSVVMAAPTASQPELDLAVLDDVQRRVLWLATSIVHHANRVRPNRSGVKVGGHQASSASMVSLMTALWFGVLEAPDRVSVKPHASPVLHALNYLLGRLDRRYLETLRQFGGLQSYPSRTKDPDPVDYSTGSVGLGATAPVWGAIAQRYVAGHFDVPVGGRQIALIGDAELDEGACWEAIADPMVSKLGEVMWVIDLNRQSLDRVVPDIAAGRLQAMFEAAGWHCVMVKYGPRLAGRPQLRERIDLMPNEEYQRLLRADARRAARAAGGRHGRPRRRRAARDVPRPRRARPRRAARRLPPGRRGPRPPERRVRVHDQGLDAADRGPPGEPLGAAQRRAVRGAGRAGRRGPVRPVGGVPGRERCGRAVRRDRAPARAGGAAVLRRRPAGRAGRPRPRAPRQRVDPAGVRALLRRPRARGAGGRRARRDGLARRRHVDQPRRLDQQGRHLVDRRPHRLVRRRHRHAGALARVRSRPPHRARHRGGQPRRAARRARGDVVAHRPAAAAGRHDLRPVRGACAGAVVVRHLRGRPVDPRRHAERRDARPGGRRAPVGHHAVDRDRAARLRRVRAGVRPGPRVDPAARALAARPAGRRVGVPAALDAPDRPVAAQRHARGGDRRRLSTAARSSTRRS